MADFLAAESDDLPIPSRETLLADLRELPQIQSRLTEVEGPAFSKRLAEEILNSLPSDDRTDGCELSRALNALRTSRDKAVAHSELTDRSQFPRARWDDVERMLQLARMWLGAVGTGYLNIAYVDDTGEYIGEFDAQVPASQLKRLLQRAGVVEAQSRAT